MSVDGVSNGLEFTLSRLREPYGILVVPRANGVNEADEAVKQPTLCGSDRARGGLVGNNDGEIEQ